MKKLIAICAGIALILAIAVPIYAANQDAKKAPAEKQDRLDGRIGSINKDKSEFDLRVGSVNRKVRWTSTTQWTYRNAPGSADNLKEGIRAICVGKFDGLVLVATRVDFRESTK